MISEGARMTVYSQLRSPPGRGKRALAKAVRLERAPDNHWLDIRDVAVVRGRLHVIFRVVLSSAAKAEVGSAEVMVRGSM